jgi:hypothetical protein
VEEKKQREHMGGIDRSSISGEEIERIVVRTSRTGVGNLFMLEGRINLAVIK